MSTKIKHTSDQELIQRAREARERAYAPYSGFAVGAAILADTGQIVTGGNVENASYSLCTCAERTAVTKAISENMRHFEAIAISTVNGAMPCGSCRQILREFAGPEGDLRVIVAGDTGPARCFTIAELLPEGFSQEQLV
ncbi:MAG: cytidine deaminase [Chloroflexi bacterium]|nr:cytidine deaminase [Chloroflexota bacterium]